MSIQTEEDLKKLREIGRIVADCLRLMRQSIQAGMSSKELDDLGAEYLISQGATSAPQLVYNFPGATCISVAHEVAHGIPKAQKKLVAGDLVNIDVSAEKDGYFADTGGSFIVPPFNQKSQVYQKLLDATQGALDAAIQVAKAGAPLNAIGQAIEKHATANGYSVIRNLGSHGIGRQLHEDPNFIPGFSDPNEKRQLEENLVITIEPFLSMGPTWVDDDEDGWTLKTAPEFRSAQFEQTMVITKGAPIILTQASQPLI